jgi:hypothetical protein
MLNRKPKKPNDAFAFFREAVDQIFEPLFTEFGFRHVETLEYMPDCVLKYLNETTGINARYELKSQLSINLVKLERTGSEVTEAAKYDLLFLMQLRQPEIDVNKFYGDDKEWTDAYIEQRLREYAIFLRESAHDVLTGDFSVFPELKKLAARNRREKNKEIFGTSTGESARFSTRPTLAQVFEGAKQVDPELERLFGGKLNQDKTDSRIYEAYWDHEFSIPEIADYLKETEESIQQQLDRYDDRD